MKLKDSDFDLDFLAEEESEPAPQIYKKPYRVLITDDDQEVHAATVLLLKNFKFEGHPLELLHSYNGDETKAILRNEDDLALIFLDVVMEESDTGLQLVDYIRKEIGNRKIRIILRTGQPGEAPEEKVIEAYDINDYRLKTELSATRLYTSVYEALRSYRDIMAIEKHRLGLSQLVHMSSEIFTLSSVESFYSSLLNQILNLEREGASAICIRESVENSGFIFLEKCSSCKIVAATGKYDHLVGKDAEKEAEIQSVMAISQQLAHSHCNEAVAVDDGYLVYRCGNDGCKTFIYIEGDELDSSLELLKDFLLQYEKALDAHLKCSRLNALNVALIKEMPPGAVEAFIDAKTGNGANQKIKKEFMAQFE